MPGNPVVGMRLDPDTVARLDRMAEIRNVTRGQLVQLALQLLPGWPPAVGVEQLHGQVALEDLSEAGSGQA